VLIIWDSHPRKIYSYDKGIDILWNKKIIGEKKQVGLKLGEE
jgi:hypothetical protein